MKSNCRRINVLHADLRIGCKFDHSLRRSVPRPLKSNFILLKLCMVLTWSKFKYPTGSARSLLKYFSYSRAVRPTEPSIEFSWNRHGIKFWWLGGRRSPSEHIAPFHCHEISPRIVSSAAHQRTQSLQKLVSPTYSAGRTSFRACRN